MMEMKWLKITIVVCVTVCVLSHPRPNFIIFLTDDQDSLLGGLIPLKKVHSFIAENGATFSNMFVTTPLCCPSRASILTGKYAHNHGVVNNSVSGNCNSYYWQTREEPNTFIKFLKKAGYSTFYAGKYLNQVGNSRYYNYSLSMNGKHVRHGFNYKKDYLTDVMVREATGFLYGQNSSRPFFVFLSFPAPHSPFTAAPQYEKKFTNITAPRTPNFNIPGGKYKHWLLRQPPSPLSKSVIHNIDEVYRKRWQALLSVDDGVEAIFKILKKKNILQHTYVFFTSDNGFHFDLAPTILDLAGLPIPSQFDGKSFAPILLADPENWSSRTSFLIEHQGEASDGLIPGCPQYRAEEVHTCEIDCICEDSWNNTYICVREFTESENSLACFFRYEHFVEVYNITEDPFQLHNLLSSGNATFHSLNSSLKLSTFVMH